MVNILVALAITALVLAIAYFTVRGYQQRLEEMATTDKLTGAANRHVFELIFQHVANAAGRQGDPVSLLTIDIDHFKELNDTYGHEGGDVVLGKFAEIVRRNIREADTLCRWGGDEFLVLLGSCDYANAEKTAEAIREAVRAEPMRLGGDQVTITLSMGVAERRDHEDLATLVKRADAALYESKRRGRDQVNVA